MHLTAEAFSKIFYDIILRLKISLINEVIYETIEQYLMYINVHLRVLKIEYNVLQMIEKNILGFEFLFEVYKQTTNQSVSAAVLKFLSTIIRAQLNFTDSAAEAISFFYMSLISDHIEQAYQNLFTNENDHVINRILEFTILLLNEVNSFKDHNILRGGANEVLELYVCDHRFSTAEEKISLSIGKYELLRNLKQKLMQKFWLDPDKISLLSKGSFLKGDDKPLSALNITNKQTIMILEKNEDDEKIIDTKPRHNENEQIAAIKIIFENMEPEFIKMALDLKDHDVVETIVMLSDPAKLFELQEDFRNHVLNEKSIKMNRRLKHFIKSKFAKSHDLFILLFKIAGIKDSQKKCLVWSLLKILPPVPTLVDNIHGFLSSIIEFNHSTKDLAHYLQQQVEFNSKKATDNELFDFNLYEIIHCPEEINLYKLHVFCNFLSTLSNAEDEHDSEIKFELQKNFIWNSGLTVFLGIFEERIDRVMNKKIDDSFTLISFGLIVNIIKSYFFVYLLFKNPDPYKRSKQVFNKKGVLTHQNLKKLEESEIAFKKNYSTDNIFSQNINSPKTQKSPHSFMTFGAQSPSKIIRRFTNPFISLSKCEATGQRER